MSDIGKIVYGANGLPECSRNGEILFKDITWSPIIWFLPEFVEDGYGTIYPGIWHVSSSGERTYVSENRFEDFKEFDGFHAEFFFYSVGLGFRIFNSSNISRECDVEVRFFNQYPLHSELEQPTDRKFKASLWQVVGVDPEGDHIIERWHDYITAPGRATDDYKPLIDDPGFRLRFNNVGDVIDVRLI